MSRPLKLLLLHRNDTPPILITYISLTTLKETNHGKLTILPGKPADMTYMSKLSLSTQGATPIPTAAWHI